MNKQTIIAILLILPALALGILALPGLADTLTFDSPYPPPSTTSPA